MVRKNKTKFRTGQIVSFLPMIKNPKWMTGKIIERPEDEATAYLVEDVQGGQHVVIGDKYIRAISAKAKKEWASRKFVKSAKFKIGDVVVSGNDTVEIISQTDDIVSKYGPHYALLLADGNTTYEYGTELRKATAAERKAYHKAITAYANTQSNPAIDDLDIPKHLQKKSVKKDEPKFTLGTIIFSTAGNCAVRVTDIKKTPAGYYYDVAFPNGKTFGNFETGFRNATPDEVKTFLKDENNSYTPKEAEKEFVILHKEDAGYEVEIFADGVENSFASKEAALEHLKKMAEQDKETRAIECAGGAWEYFIAEIVKPVKIFYDTKINVRIEEN